MSATNNAVAVGQVNAEVIQGLREVADWLEAHPELPRVSSAAVYIYAHGFEVREPRAALTAVADALGERATETTRGNEVVISGEFAGAKVRAAAGVKDLGVRPVVITPEYEPIIQPRAADPPVTPEEDAAWAERER